MRWRKSNKRTKRFLARLEEIEADLDRQADVDKLTSMLAHFPGMQPLARIAAAMLLGSELGMARAAHEMVNEKMEQPPDVE